MCLDLYVIGRTFLRRAKSFNETKSLVERNQPRHIVCEEVDLKAGDHEIRSYARLAGLGCRGDHSSPCLQTSRRARRFRL